MAKREIHSLPASLVFALQTERPAMVNLTITEVEKGAFTPKKGDKGVATGVVIEILKLVSEFIEQVQEDRQTIQLLRGKIAKLPDVAVKLTVLTDTVRELTRHEPNETE